MIRPSPRPVVLAAVLVPVHLGTQLLLLGRLVPALLVLPLLAVAAFEAADAAADRRSEQKRLAGPAGPRSVDRPFPGRALDEERRG